MTLRSQLFFVMAVLALNAGVAGAARQQQQEQSLKVIHQVAPIYPVEAKRQGIQGEVAVEIKVNDKGEVTEARAVSGNDLLRKAAVDAAKQFRFSNEVRATVAATLTFNFALGSKK